MCERTNINGAKRIRTADPLNAIEVLYQLSYSPLSCDIHHDLASRSSQELSRKRYDPTASTTLDKIYRGIRFDRVSLPKNRLQ